MSTEKILERVRKMLAIANDQAATEHERDTALQMSYRLLAKHNLTMLDASDPEPEARDKFKLETFGMVWSRSVCGDIASLFFCSHFYGKKINATKMAHYFVGKESNATTAMLMSTFVINSILKEARKLYKHNLAPESRSFATGAANRLYVRIAQIKAEATTKDSEPGTALMLVNLYDSEEAENDAKIKELGLDVKERNVRVSNVDTNAYKMGQEFGNSINLSNQVGHNNENQGRLS